MVCPECNHECNSLNECVKYKTFNLLVEDARKIAKLKKWIKSSVAHFKGKNSWFVVDNPNYNIVPIQWDENYYRFMTITFDPKKFSFRELADPNKLHNYVQNAIWDVKDLFKGNILLIREYHKSGVPHYHLCYNTYDTDTLNHLKLRMRYYFSAHLKNHKCIHDRVFNEGGKTYVRKANHMCWRFSGGEAPIPPREGEVDYPEYDSGKYQPEFNIVF